MLHERECPFAGQGFSKKEVKKEARLQGRARRAFTSQELAPMFVTRLFACPVPVAPSTTKIGLETQAKFWSMLIGLYAALRLGEISMLRPSDIQVEDGVPHFRLTDDAHRSFKSKAGARVVPLHPVLLRLRLMEVARAAQAAGCECLLPGIKDTPKQRGANISKWFTRYRRSVGVDTRQTVFHSFRHSFVSAIRGRRGTDDVLVDQIVGHDDDGSVRHTYTGPLHLALKAEMVAAIDCELDLSTLFAPAAVPSVQMDGAIHDLASGL